MADLNQEDEQQKSFFDTLKQLKPTPPPEDTGVNQSINTLLAKPDKEFEEAKKQRSNLQLLGMLGNAASLTGASIAGQKPQGEVFNQILKMSEQPVEDVSERQKVQNNALKNAQAQEALKNDLAKQDPNHPLSDIGRNLAREVAQKANLKITIPENISFANLEKLYPGLEGMANRKLQSDQLALQRKNQMDDKSLKRIADAREKLGKDLDPTGFRAGTLRDNQRRIDAAQRVETLYDAVKGNPSAINMRELASSVAGMLSSGSNVAVSQIDELVPKTMSGDAAKVQEWLTSNPTGAGQQKFAQMYLHIAQRERDTAANQIRQAQFKKAYQTHGWLKEQSPDDFYSSLSTATGLDKDTIKAMEANPQFKGQYIPEASKEKEDKSDVQNAANEVERKTSDGKIAIFDGATKKFLRYK